MSTNLDLTAFDTAHTGVSQFSSNSNSFNANDVIDFDSMAIELPDGRHRIVVEEVEFRTTSTGKPALNLKLRVEEGGQYDGILRWTMFVLADRAMVIVARQFKAITGEKLTSMSPNEMIAKLTGRSAIADFKTVTNNRGEEQQQVRGIYPDRERGSAIPAFDFGVN